MQKICRILNAQRNNIIQLLVKKIRMPDSGQTTSWGKNPKNKKCTKHGENQASICAILLNKEINLEPKCCYFLILVIQVYH